MIVTLGYPPQELYLDDEKTIGEYVSSGDTLTVSKLENPHVQKQKPSFSSLHRIPKRIEVPDDNSCLFNAVSYCFENHTFDMSTVLREITSSIILSNPELYNEAMLGKGNQEYSEWISKPTSWGGAIEISVLSNYYEAEIFVFEVANNMKNCFGEGQGYNKRIYLIYDGIHYDALAMVDQKHNIATIFDSTDSSATEVFESLTMKEKSLGKYTDTAKFTLLCNDCKQSKENLFPKSRF